MQESTPITFEPIRRTSVPAPWEIVLAILPFAGLIHFAISKSRRQPKKPGSLKLGGK